jgi:biopolymer transport protein ExbB
MLKYMLDGGSMMWPLLALSIVGLAVMLERWRVFQLASKDTSAMRRMVFQLLSSGKVDDAIRLCEETRGPVAAVLLVGLGRYKKLLALQRGKSEIEESISKSMGDYAPHVIAALDKRISLLLLVGSSAPLLGMTGTVTGMIRAFSAMSSAGALQGSVVAGGIAEALITTAAGLLIAVPAVIAYNFFSTRLEQLTIRIEEAANELVSYIHLREQV